MTKADNFEGWCIYKNHSEWQVYWEIGQKSHLHMIHHHVDHSTHPLCILQKSFACFFSVKIFQILLSVSQDCVHMSLVFNSKFKGPEN